VAKSKKSEIRSEIDRLRTLVPLVDESRRIVLLRRLKMLGDQTTAQDVRKWTTGTLGESGIAGTGALRFESRAPPGIGRLVRLPMYLATVGNANLLTDGGLGALPNWHPEVILQIAAGGPGEIRSIGPLVFTTREVTWATLRVVGFKVAVREGVNIVTYAAGHPTAPAGDPFNGGAPTQDRICTRVWFLGKDLQVGGGTSLFASDGFTDLTPFYAEVYDYAGLRDYPILERTNTATVSLVLHTGHARIPAPGGWTAVRESFAVWLVCEVMEDDQIGNHRIGPYARGQAMKRRRTERQVNVVTR
jgi:hypothetical protein